MKSCSKCKSILTKDNWLKSCRKNKIYTCKDCCREYARQYRKKHRQKMNKAARECRARKCKIDPLYRRKSKLKSEYGLTLEQYDRMFEEQDGVCVICGGINVDGRRLHIDHDHQTGKIRGLLCFRCNVWLGVLEKNKEFFINAKKYLQKF